MKKIVTIVGARPQFIKAASFSHYIREHSNIQELVVHTGQHYDKNLSEIFFNELSIPKPYSNLNINNKSHGSMTGEMLIKCEKIIIKTRPDAVVVFGDTNSTLAGALAASKLNAKVAHIEAGLRSFNFTMPEEQNRIVTDHLSQLLYCPTNISYGNLQNEGLVGRKDTSVQVVGDIMKDSVRLFKKYSQKPTDISIPNKYCLATLHRAENTNHPEKLRRLVQSLEIIHSDFLPVILCLHPRTRKILSELAITPQVHVIDPVSYFKMQFLLEKSDFVITDSGGLQKEAYFHEKMCITLREETEWTELIENKVNFLSGSSIEETVNLAKLIFSKKISFEAKPLQIYGDGYAGQKIIQHIEKNI